MRSPAATARETAALNLRWADALVGALCAGGVRHAVVSPGSRSTPVMLAMAARSRADGRGPLRLHVVIDERAAAFHALGLARITGAPVVLSCTSGSAGAHWLPAVIEADHSRLPLVLLTADRPPELHHAGAPQTVAQGDLFGGHLRLRADPGAPAPGDLAWLRTLAARAVDAAAGARPGPVHLNLPFREPLWDPSVEAPEPTDLAPTVARGRATLDPAAIAELARELLGRGRGVLSIGPGDIGVCGATHADQTRQLSRSARRLARALGWPLLVDGASGARFAPDGEHVVTTADLLTRSPVFARATPDAVVRVGQVPTSKPLAAWLATAPAGASLLVDPCGDWRDPYHASGRLLHAEPVALMDALSACASELAPLPPTGPWLARWQAAERAALGALTRARTGAAPGGSPEALWAGEVARAAVAALPEGGLLHAASSLAVRAVDSFSGSAARQITVTANRGANGIDGTLATALGEAAAWDGGPVVALVGDLAFLHDLGSLVTCRPAADAGRTTIVVLDNRGGGIFDHLPIAAHPTAFERCFVAETAADIPALARAAGAECATVADRRGLEEALARAVEAPGLAVVHVRIERAQDLAAHAAMRAAVHDALERSLS